MILDSLLFTSVLDAFIVLVATAGLYFCAKYYRSGAFEPLRLELGLLSAGLAVWWLYHMVDFVALNIGPVFTSTERAHLFSDFMHENVRFFTDILASGLLGVGFLRMLTRVAQTYSELSRSANDLKQEIGSRDRTEEELLANAAHQQEVSRAKSEFLVSISHELRTPLNGILGLASLLSNTGLSDDQNRLLSTLEQSAKAMLTRVSDVLDLARLESGQRELRPMLFNPCEVATSVEALFQPFAGEKDLELTAACPAGSDRNVIGDLQLVRQALSNLVSNAIKYSPSGAVTIDTRLVESEKERYWLEYTVTDSGIGIEPNIAERLSRRSGTVNQAEVGLGLAICWHIARLLEGNLELEAANPGTRVVLRVQVQREPDDADVAETV